MTVTANNTNQFTNPVDGGIIGFTVNPAANGASAALSADTATISGSQASVTATADTAAGNYTVTVSVSGVTTPANFNLTNNPGAAATITEVSGSGQSTTVAQSFANPLVALVTDTYGNPVPGVSVIFAAPTSGAAATLSSSTATTGTNGEASVSATANTIAGNYTVTVSVSGVTTPANFNLTNNPGAAATITEVSGSGQSTTVAQSFANPLVALVTDTYGNPVPNVSVTFAEPGSGASASVTGSPATTGANGQASVTATANTVAGSYSVTASVSGVTSSAGFSLTNTPRRGGDGRGGLRLGPVDDRRPELRQPAGGRGQGRVRQPGPPGHERDLHRLFGRQRRSATLIPSSAPPDTSGQDSATATTDANGQASVAATANTLAGTYIVTASVANGTTLAGFFLTNSPTSTTTTLASSVNPSVNGEEVSFTATVTANAPGAGTPTGTVTFMDGTTALGTGTLGGVSGNDQATFTTSPVGQRQPALHHRGLQRRHQRPGQHFQRSQSDGQPGRDHGGGQLVGQPVGQRPGGDLHGHRLGQRPGRRHAHRHGHVHRRHDGTGHRHARRGQWQ